MLRERWIGTAIRSRNGCAVAQRPYIRVTATPHRPIDRHPATLIVRDGNPVARTLGTVPAASTIVPASMISFATRIPEVSMDADGRRDADVGAAPLEHARSHDRQLLVDLGQNACTSLEQQKANLVAPESRIEAEHVIRER